MKRSLEERLKEVENEVAQIKKEINKTKFYGKKIGDTFELIGIPWKVLDITEKGYACLAMEPVIENKKFGTYGNNWRDSNLREWLHKNILPKIKEELGEDQIIKFKRNLISLDGITEYGECIDEISLISIDEYRKYRRLIPNSKKEWWWTITPWSTKSNDDNTWVAVVSPSGNFSYDYFSLGYGVRPFCIFSSDLFESGRE